MNQAGGNFTRRTFLHGATAAAGLSLLRPSSSALGEDTHPTRITQVFLDLNNIHKWDNSNGDTWDPFWADDGNLYAFNCDGRGFGAQPRNLAFNKLAGHSIGSLAGSSVNSMDEYGRSGLRGPDGATWKACGQECIDGVFYAFVSRNTYGSQSGDPLLRQTAVNSSLIKSTDRGLTWTRSAAENYARPMWFGPRFGAPFFVHYGRNGGTVIRDRAQEFVYATSSNGFWNDGDSYILGRVDRHKLPQLRSSDWSYFAGGNGLLDKSWSREIAEAKPILSSPAHCGQGPVCYIPALNLYLLIAWYNTEKMTKWFEPTHMKYDFYQAEHPWGPWSFINSHTDDFISSGHMYGPSLCARFQSREGSSVVMHMFTSGCPFKDIPSGLYKMWQIPLVLRTDPISPVQSVKAVDPRILYHGAWNSGSENLPSLNAHTRYTVSEGSSAEFDFTGTGIAFITEKGPEFGIADLYLDDSRSSLALETPNFPSISSVQTFAASGLAKGRHHVRIVNRTSRLLALAEFQITE
ncbi:MAG TPA: hypothetical protein VGR47_07810 [Terracidiphilus sp.]|nr:hypothetical protein [Terracidiphilus sp.]